MTKILIDRAVVEQALHVATGAGYPVALVAALKAALAEPVQEPVAYSYHPCTFILIEALKEFPNGKEILAKWDEARAKVDTIQAAPPQRKPLTEEEIDQRYYVSTGQMLREQDKRLAFLFARAVEAAHGIKNQG
jgi:hypothetical protein